MYATVGTVQPHPIDGVAGRSGTVFNPQVGTDEPRETSVCYVSHEVGIRPLLKMNESPAA